MRTFRVVAAVIAVTTLGVIPAAAQEPGNVGLTMTSDSTVGLTIKAGDRVAIRPELGYGRTKIKDEDFGDRTSTTWTPGLSVLFYVKSWDNTRLYLAPQWAYSRTTLGQANNVGETKSSGHTFAAMIGAQHNITDRFAVFGEAGLGRSTSKTNSTFSASKSTSWSTSSTVGAILFF